MRNFKSHPVIRIINPTEALFVRGIEPIWPNQNQHYFAFCETLLEHLRKFGSGAHINVNKHVLATKLLFQILADAKRVGTAVLTPIAYENLARHFTDIPW